MTVGFESQLAVGDASQVGVDFDPQAVHRIGRGAATVTRRRIREAARCVWTVVHLSVVLRPADHPWSRLRTCLGVGRSLRVYSHVDAQRLDAGADQPFEIDGQTEKPVTEVAAIGLEGHPKINGAGACPQRDALHSASL